MKNTITSFNDIINENEIIANEEHSIIRNCIRTFAEGIDDSNISIDIDDTEFDIEFTVDDKVCNIVGEYLQKEPIKAIYIDSDDIAIEIEDSNTIMNTFEPDVYNKTIERINKFRNE
jgi:hypothetical protein